LFQLGYLAGVENRFEPGVHSPQRTRPVNVQINRTGRAALSAGTQA
jgi:hypothetical protein